MEWMLDLRTYGMKIMFSSTTPGYIDWHGDQIMFKDIQFTMSQFRGMVHQLVHDLRERMLSKMRIVTEGLCNNSSPYKMYGRPKFLGLGYVGWVIIHVRAE